MSLNVPDFLGTNPQSSAAHTRRLSNGLVPVGSAGSNPGTGTNGLASTSESSRINPHFDSSPIPANQPSNSQPWNHGFPARSSISFAPDIAADLNAHTTNGHRSTLDSTAVPQVDFRSPNFDLLLHSKLLALEHLQHDSTAPFLPLAGPTAAGEALWGSHNTFNLPLELQGGIGTISSRRPSYAAESFTRSTHPFTAGGSSTKNSLATFAAANNFSLSAGGPFQFSPDQLADSFGNFSLNNGYTDFQARRPSQLAEFQSQGSLQPRRGLLLGGQVFQNQGGSKGSRHGSIDAQVHDFLNLQMSSHFPTHHMQPSAGYLYVAEHPTNHQTAAVYGNVPSGFGGELAGMKNFGADHAKSAGTVPLENGLYLKGQNIFASRDLQHLYWQASSYFHDPELSGTILSLMATLLSSSVVGGLVTFIRNLNNLTYNHKQLCLAANKSGKLDLYSYPNNSNLSPQKQDLVIVDGDRGKDLVMILEPLVDLNFAILFNFLKKNEHLRSLTITDANGGSSVKSNHCGGTHSTSLDASSIINLRNNEDNEFIITLPTKQVLRFATPKEVQKLSNKFLEERKAFTTCFNKIKDLGLDNDLTLINVEYQSDFKKLIIYYFANFHRIDFRGLIKELFKIYKTRIWLCAVLPYDCPQLYTDKVVKSAKNYGANRGIPAEYSVSNEHMINFSVDEFARLQKPTYFHLRNILNLVRYLEGEVKGHFYGFNTEAGSGAASSGTSRSNTVKRGALKK